MLINVDYEIYDVWNQKLILKNEERVGEECETTTHLIKIQI